MKTARILVAAACAATLFSCTKENLPETSRVNLTFNVANELSASKAVLNANAVVFQAGDKIGVWDGTSMNCFETTAGGANASFSGTAASAETYILVSPYNDNYSVNGSVVTFSIPDIQVATPGSVDPNALVSMAKVSGTTGDVLLYNCVGLVKVVVPDGLTVKEIHLGGGSNSSVGICGSFTFNTNDKVLTGYVDMRTSITLVPQAGQSVIAPGTYYIAVRPFTYGGITLAYVNADNQLCKRTTTKSVAVALNHILPVGTLNITNYTPVTGRAVLRYAGAAPQFTGLIKKLAIGANENLAANYTDNVIKKIVFKAHKLPYKTGGTEIQNSYGTNSDVHIYAWVDGDTAYVYTEAPIITLYGSANNNSADLFRDFAALEEVSFNDVNAMANTSISYMFRNDTKLKKVDFGNADFSNVKDYSFMLANCGNLEYLSFGETSTLATANMTKALKNANGLKYLYFGKNFSLPSNNTEFMTGTAQLSKPCDLYCSHDMYDALTGSTSAGFDATYFTYHAL